MFRTRVVIVLKDCKAKEIFRTPQGDSREKELKEGYKEAIEKSFEAIAAMDYRYEPSRETVTLNFDDDVRALPTDNAEEPAPTSPAVVQEGTPEVQRYEDRRPK